MEPEIVLLLFNDALVEFPCRHKTNPRFLFFPFCYTYCTCYCKLRVDQGNCGCQVHGSSFLPSCKRSFVVDLNIYTAGRVAVCLFALAFFFFVVR